MLENNHTAIFINLIDSPNILGTLNQTKMEFETLIQNITSGLASVMKQSYKFY